MKKRLLSLALALVTCLSLVPLAAFAAGWTVQVETDDARYAYEVSWREKDGTDHRGEDANIPPNGAVTVYITPKPGYEVESFRVVEAVGPSFPAVSFTDYGDHIAFLMPDTNVSVYVTMKAALKTPAITAQPVSASVTEGGDAAFSVTATGTAPLTYQWYYKSVSSIKPVFVPVNAKIAPAMGVSGISGQTTSTLTLTGIPLTTDGAQFYCIAANSAGEARSDSVTLTVKNLPVVTVHPADVSVAEGGTAEFSITASGSAPLTYQWYSVPAYIPGGKTPVAVKVTDTSGKVINPSVAKNPTAAITGSATAELTITGVPAELDGTQYYCAVTNAAGNMTSKNAALTVKSAAVSATPPGTTTPAPSTTTPPGTTTPSPNAPAGEVVSDWAKPEIEKADALDLIPAALKGKDLTQPITRAEFAALSVKVYETLSGTEAVPAGVNPFTDTKDTDVLKAYNTNIVAGVAADKFAPSALLDREQAATMLTRVYKRVTISGWTLADDAKFTLPYTKPAAFADDAKISDWAKDSVYFMVANGIIAGTGNNNFSPKATTDAEKANNYASATREQALAIAVRMVENLGK